MFSLAKGLLPVGTTKDRFPDIDAVGEPDPFIFMNANLAVVVAFEPSNKSSELVIGDKAPIFLCQKLLAAVAHEDQLGVVPPIKHCEAVPAADCPISPVVEVYKTPPAFK
jgi:hypothetical protein